MRLNDLFRLMFLYAEEGAGGGEGEGAGGEGAGGKGGEGGEGAGGGEGEGAGAGEGAGGEGGEGEGDSLLGREGDGGKPGEGKGDGGDAGKPKGDTGAPETYSEFKVPEGMSIEAGQLEQFSPVAKELGLTQEQAQKLIDLQTGMTQQQAEKFEETIKTWQDEVKADKEFGGTKVDESIQAVREMINRAVSKEDAKALWSMFKDTGYGSYPPLFRLMSKLARSTSEDSFSGPGQKGDTPGSSEQAFHDEMYPTMTTKEGASG